MAIRIPAKPDKRDYTTRHLEKYPGRYNVLFAGTSVTQCGLIPVLFDSELRKRGYEIRSHNIALTGHPLHGTHQLIRSILNNKANASVGFVLMDIKYFAPEISEALMLKRRSIMWHDFGATADALTTTWKVPKDSLQVKMERTFSHSTHLGLHYIPVGRGRSYFGHRSTLKDDWDLLDRRFTMEGYAPYEQDGPDCHGSFPVLGDASGYGFNDEFFDSQDEWDKYRSLQKAKWDEIQSREGKRGFVESHFNWKYNPESMTRQIRFLEEKGVTPIYFPPPYPHDTRYLKKLSEEVGFELWEIFDPMDEDSLYSRHNLRDVTHFNRKGARSYTLLVADMFSAYLDENPDIGMEFRAIDFASDPSSVSD